MAEKVKQLEGSGKLITQEEKRDGTLSLSVYSNYFKSAGVYFFSFSVLVCALETAGRAFADWYSCHF